MAQNETYLNSACTKNPNNLPLFIQDLKKHDHHLQHPWPVKKEPFAPIDPKNVRMYVCGMTVYDYCHLGHARVMVVFDMIARWLRECGYPLTYVRNITEHRRQNTLAGGWKRRNHRANWPRVSFRLCTKMPILWACCVRILSRRRRKTFRNDCHDWNPDPKRQGISCR